MGRRERWKYGQESSGEVGVPTGPEQSEKPPTGGEEEGSESLSPSGIRSEGGAGPGKDLAAESKQEGQGECREAEG